MSGLGKGAEEYLDVSYVNIVPDKNQIAVIDKVQDKIHYYGYSGKYEYSEQIPFLFSYFEFLGHNCKAFEISGKKDSTIEEYSKNPLIVANIKNEIIYGAFDDFFNVDQFTYVTHNPLRKFEDKVYISPDFSNMIYMVEDSAVIPKYHINMKRQGIPPLDKSITNKTFSYYCSKYHIFNGDFIELKDFTCVNILTPFGYPSVVYSHAAKKSFIITEKGNHPFLKNIAPKARYGDNTIVFDIQASIITSWKEELYKNPKNQKIRDDLYEGLTFNSNPVLFFCHVNINNEKVKK